jgi:hypothetical protein
MEAVSASETSVDLYEATQHSNPEDTFITPLWESEILQYSLFIKPSKIYNDHLMF